MFNTVIYIFFILLSIYLMNFGEKKNSKVSIIVSVLLLTCLGGFRSGIGTDFPNYEKMYNVYATNKSSAGFNAEILYKLLMSCSLFFNFSFITFNIFIQLITNFVFYMAIRNKKNEVGLTFPWAIYSLRYYLLGYNIVRQMLAMAFCLLAFSYYNKNYIKSILYVVVGVGFHNSAIICIIPLLCKLFYKSKHSNYFYFSILLFFYVAIVRLDLIMRVISIIFPSMNYINYFGSAGFGHGGSIYGYLFVVVPAIIPILIVYPKIFSNREYHFYLFIYLFGFILSIFNLMTTNQLGRIAYYFTMIHIFLLPYCCRVLCDRYNKIIIPYYSYLLTFFMFCWDYIILNNGQIVPYRFFLLG